MTCYMTQDANNLIWIDLEMTGLDTNNDKIIEIATIVTDAQLNILAEGPMLAIHQSNLGRQIPRRVVHPRDAQQD